jgi:hypothetical protein
VLSMSVNFYFWLIEHFGSWKELNRTELTKEQTGLDGSDLKWAMEEAKQPQGPPQLVDHDHLLQLWSMMPHAWPSIWGSGAGRRWCRWPRWIQRRWTGW